MQPVNFRQRSFVDRIDYGQMLRHELGIDFSSIQLNAGDRKYEMESFELASSGLCIGRTRLHQTEYSEFSVPEGHTLISISPNPAPVFCDGRKVNTGRFFLFPSGKKIRTVYFNAYTGFDLLVPDDEFSVNEILSSETRGNVMIADELHGDVCEFVTVISERFRDAAIARDDATQGEIAEQTIEFALERLGRVIERQLYPAILCKKEETRRHDLVARASDYVSEHIQQSLKAKCLAGELGVSSRLLGYAFNSALGISPYQFILAKKLHAVRAAIKSSEEPVNAIADRYGFTTPSRFRGQYSSLFGELPSETRKTGLRAA